MLKYDSNENTREGKDSQVCNEEKIQAASQTSLIVRRYDDSVTIVS